jgi:hypothetical protein
MHESRVDNFSVRAIGEAQFALWLLLSFGSVVTALKTEKSCDLQLWVCSDSAGLANNNLPLVCLRKGIAGGVSWTMTNRRFKTTSAAPNFQLFGPETS